MSGAHPEPTEPRIIKKKKAHGGAWKVAYADFVTAMMALFIVLWIMSQSQSVRQNVAQYFKNPGLLPGATGLLETSDVGGEMPTPGHSQDLQTPAPIPPVMANDCGSLEEVKKRISEVIAQLPELSHLKDQVALEITDEGLRIELMDKENSHFFDLGSASLKAETQELLGIIAKELGKLPNHIPRSSGPRPWETRGHAGSRPGISGPGPVACPASGGPGPGRGAPVIAAGERADPCPGEHPHPGERAPPAPGVVRPELLPGAGQRP